MLISYWYIQFFNVYLMNQNALFSSIGERPFNCPYEGCTRSFTTSNIRKVHMRTHTGERPYVCEIEGCNRSFASATNYKNHSRIHTGGKLYCCLPNSKHLHIPIEKFSQYVLCTPTLDRVIVFLRKFLFAQVENVVPGNVWCRYVSTDNFSQVFSRSSGYKQC